MSKQLPITEIETGPSSSELPLEPKMKCPYTLSVSIFSPNKKNTARIYGYKKNFDLNFTKIGKHRIIEITILTNGSIRVLLEFREKIPLKIDKVRHFYIELFSTENITDTNIIQNTK